MKKKILAALFLLFLIFSAGAVLSIYYISNTTTTLNRLITLHQIEDLRQHLIISIQTTQSDLYTVKTLLANKVDTIVDNITKLEDAANTCGDCHHEPEVERGLNEISTLILSYQNALSYYITSSANRERIEKLKLDTAEIGNKLLNLTSNMSMMASQKLAIATQGVMDKIKHVRMILYFTLAITFILGVLISIILIRSITRPIEKLVMATRAISDGDLTYEVDVDDSTEFGELARHFNEMSHALKENHYELVNEIQERRRIEKDLLESKERYALAARGANDGLWDMDLRRNTVYYSYRWKTMLGFGEDEIGNSLEDWLGKVHEIDREQVEMLLHAHIEGTVPHFECEYRIYDKSKTIHWMLSRGLAVRDEEGKAYRMAGSQTDISIRKATQEQLIHDAFHDTLTDLPNRALFMDRLKHVIDGSLRNRSSVYAVLFTDLDRFKVINDSMGHTVGDSLLIEVGQRLKSCLRPGDTVARLGGDEFAILLDGLENMEEAEVIAERILKVSTKPFRIDGQEFFTSQSIGIAFESERYEFPEEVIRDADIAMYQAKAKGGARFVFFDSTMHAGVIDRNQLESDLRSAVDHLDDFVLNYQPIMCLNDSKLKGFEALVRWHHPTRGLISPDDFIPLAEETGVIIPLTQWILKEACHQLKIWLDTALPSEAQLTMSVNVSSKVLIHKNFVDAVVACLEEEGIKPHNLALEITENIILDHTKIAMNTLTELKRMGVHIHIDDFGTGYSSLSYLQNFPVNALKIDRSFINQIVEKSDNNDIVKTIITLAQNFNLYVIAEGVEESHQLSTMRGLDCTYGQGFFFSKPLSAEAMTDWLTTNHS
ncbi:MAG: EAL domain-containing protein [Proteobacteria bacterium]|nr:EAL domain-containing protein [Pseudomonadota bacterium]MBU1686935.1 EAL domain-containing protein [Pseudomonadota bacterium]